jgi:hypothetical protein
MGGLSALVFGLGFETHHTMFCVMGYLKRLQN